MIIAFNSEPLWVVGWLTKITVTHRFILVLCILLSICSSLNAQFSTRAKASANYKRPYEAGMTRHIPGRYGLFIITKSNENDHQAGWGCTWRYHTAPDQLVITITSKSKMEINPLTTSSNYKVQHIRCKNN